MILVVVACAIRRPDVVVADGAATLPLLQPTTDRSRWYAAADAPGLAAGLFFLDTGYAVSACDDDFVAALGLTSHGNVRMRGTVGVVSAGIVELPTLWIGPHRVDGLRCAVRDLGTSSSVVDPPEIDVFGVLGMDVWSHFAVEVTEDAWVVRPSTGDGDHRLYGEGRVGRRARLEVDLDGVRRRLVLDTGSDTTLVRNLPLPSAPVTLLLAGSGDGSRKPTTARRWTVEASVAGENFGIIRPVEVAAVPVVGLDLIGRRAWTWDFPARLWSLSAGLGPKPAPAFGAPAGLHFASPEATR